MIESLKGVTQTAWWQYEVLSNTVGVYITAVVAFIIIYLLLQVFQYVILRRLRKFAERTKTPLDDAFIRIIASLKPPFYFFISAYLAISFITLAAVLQKVINVVLIGWIIYQAMAALSIFIDYALRRIEEKEGEGEQGTKMALRLVGKIAKAALWMIGILLALSNFGVNVSSLIAGLGIGGIAIALAAQNLLGDLFSSFAIYFDKPFVVGDYIVVGDKKGVVERIGIKTTRIRASYGEEIIISNQELTSTQIQNFKTMEKRRSVFTFGVVYETPQRIFERIPQMVKEIIDSVSDVTFDRVHFTQFNDSSLDFEVVYYVSSSDYRFFKDRNQEILFKIKKRFEDEKISMAYPTRTVYVHKNVG